MVNNIYTNAIASMTQNNSLYRAFQNYDTSAGGSITVPSVSYATGTFGVYTLTIPIQRGLDVAQTRINYSHLSDRWYVFPHRDVSRDANFNIATVGSYTSSGFTLSVYVVNVTGGTFSNTAFTATARTCLFVAPWT